MAYTHLFHDSFDHEAAAADLATKWSSYSSLTGIGGAYAFVGSQGLSLTGSNGLWIGLSPSDGTKFVMAARVKFVALPSTAWHLASFANTDGVYGGNQYFHVSLSVSGSTFVAYRDGYGLPPYTGMATVLGTSPAILKQGVWYWIAVKGTIHDSTGTIDVYVNGELVWSLSSKDTKCTYGSGTWNLFCIGGGGATTAYVDEIHIGEGDAVPPERRCDCHYPNAVGSDDAWSKSAGNAYECLDDAQVNTSVYIYTSTLNAQTSVNIEALKNAGGTIAGVQVSCYATKMDANAAGFKIYLRLGGAGTRYYSNEFFPSNGSWSFFHWIWLTNPAGGSWTESDFNSLEAGVEKTT